MALLFVLGQGADLITWAAFRPTEMNPIVLGAPIAAVAGKLIAMAVLGVTGLYLTGTRYQEVARALLTIGAVWGIVGAYSNL